MVRLNPDTPASSAAKKVRAVIFDWAGTTVDFGSLAPVKTLEKVFSGAGLPITEQEARLDMGIAKRDHIAKLLAMPRIRKEWLARHGHEAGPTDLDRLYDRFVPLQFECLREYAQVIRDVPEVVDQLRNRGIKIGSTTGYTRAMLDVLAEDAAKAGYSPDSRFTPEDAGAGRPYPFMIYAAALKMQVYPLAAIVKVGDTPADIHEGLNAGAWSVGVAATGNGIGMPEENFLKLHSDARARKLQTARHELEAAGAHYVVDTLAELPAVIEDVESRFSRKITA